MKNKLITYKKSGVNIKAADKFVNFISSVSSKKKGKNWDSTHRKKSADIIDPVQKQKFRKNKKKNKQIKDSEIQKRRNRKTQIQTNEICQKAT